MKLSTRMDGSEFAEIDFAAYLYGMFFAGACIMGAYGAVVGIKSIDGFEIPLAIIVAMLGYLWWSGENINVFSYFF